MPSVSKAQAKASETTFTLSDHPYSYFHLQLTTIPRPSQQSRSSISEQQTNLDEISLRQYMTAALQQSFGLIGSATLIDILKVDGREAWVRLQSQDAHLLVAALSQWSSAAKGVSLRIVSRSTWLGGLSVDCGNEKLWSLEK